MASGYYDQVDDLHEAPFDTAEYYDGGWEAATTANAGEEYLSASTEVRPCCLASGSPLATSTTHHALRVSPPHLTDTSVQTPWDVYSYYPPGPQHAQPVDEPITESSDPPNPEPTMDPEVHFPTSTNGYTVSMVRVLINDLPTATRLTPAHQRPTRATFSKDIHQTTGPSTQRLRVPVLAR